MIIYIDKTIAEHGDFTYQEENMFTELACAHKRGDCFLCGHTLSIDRLKKDISAYRWGVDSNHSELGALFGEVETVVIITYGEKPNLPKSVERIIKAQNEQQDGEEQQTKYVRVVSVEQAINYRLGDQCIFLCESTNDCALYKLFAERYMYSIRDRIRGVSLSLKDENGGGQTTFQQLEKCVRTEHHLTVCVTDSDKKHGVSEQFVNKPGLGQTASALLAAQNTLESEGLDTLFDLLVLDVHEIENLLPLSVLDDVAQNGVQDARRGIDYLRLLQVKKEELNRNAREQNDKDKEKYPEVMLCYDVKKGVNIQTLKNDLQNPKKKKKVSKALLAYWEEVAEIVGDDSIPGVAEKILTHAMRRMEEVTASGYKKVVDYPLDEYLIDHWETIGKKVFSWGIANKPMPTAPFSR